MKLFHPLGLLLACTFLSGCAGTSSSADNNARTLPIGRTDVIRTGDKIDLRLSGVPGDEGYLIAVQVPQNGDITVPLLKDPIHVAGKTTGDVAAEIIEAYRSQQIYSNPDVTVLPEERYVSVGGEVRSPTRVMYTPDLTLLTAINASGGFTDYAKRNSVRVIRGTQIMYIDCTKAVGVPGADPALYPGDQIYVPRTIF